MGRCVFPRRGLGRAVALSVIFSLPVLVGAARGSCATPLLDDDPSEVAALSTLDLTGLETQFTAVANKVSASVVAISASATPVDTDDALRTENLNPDRLDGILSRLPRTVGTGFFIDPDGYILTNEHVICEAEQLWVTTDDRNVYPAIVIGSDPRSDLAVLKIPASGMKVATLAKPGTPKRGQWTIAIGNPFGMAAEGEMAMSVGVVSATERSLPKLSQKENRLYSNLIQTTAEINPGNSGGPLFNLAGEVIGVNTAVILPQKQTNGIGFAIPITEGLLAHVDQLKQGREIVYGFLGVTVIDPTQRERTLAGVATGGTVVQRIEEKSPVHGSRLRKDDVVTAVNGIPVANSDAFIRMIGLSPIDKPVTLTVFRDRKPLDLVVTPQRRPMPPLAVNRQSQRLRWRGITLTAVPLNWPKSGLAAPQGVYVVGIEDLEAGRKLGIKPGQIITSIAGKAITSVAELQTAINSLPLDDLKLETADGAAMATAQD